MKFLMHQRDDTVHEGIRGARHSLVGCIDCHASKDDAGQWVRIDAPGQFCASCHEYVSVKIDCFECHAALPTMAFRGGGGVNGRHRTLGSAARRRFLARAGIVAGAALVPGLAPRSSRPRPADPRTR